MELSERIRRGAQLLCRFDENHPITQDIYWCADDVEKLEKENKALRANASKSVLRRLSHQLGYDMGGYEKEE